MVPLILKKEQEILSQNTIESLILHRYNELSLDGFNPDIYNHDTYYAACGFLGKSVDSTIINKIISRPVIKGIDYSNSIYNFIGIHLACVPILKSEIMAKFVHFSIENKFVTRIFFPFLEDDFKNALQTCDGDFACIIKLLYKDDLSDNDEHFIERKLSNNDNASIIDIMLYRELLKKFTRFRYNTMGTVDIIASVFNNLQDAIKHLTMLRRKDHTPFLIEDEYDVQDLLYFVLRSIFPRLQFENPHFKIGGTNSKVDLMLVQEGIDIEIKMIKAKNQDEKEFIKQLKIDINDYAAWNELKHLLVFVYDPFNKTSNKNNFYDLNGHKSINGTEFDVTVFVSN